MTSKTTNKHEKFNVNPKLGGYSDFRLWPCYMVFSGLMLWFGPSLGWLGSLIIVGTPSFLIARSLSKKVYVPYEQYDSDRYIKDVAIALERGFQAAELTGLTVLVPTDPQQFQL